MGERLRVYGKSIAERLDDGRRDIEGMVHRNPKEHSTSEIISFTDPNTGGTVEVVWTLVSRDGQQEWCFTLRVGQGPIVDTYYQTGDNMATYAPCGGGAWEHNSQARFVEMTEAVECWRDAATRRPDLLRLNAAPVPVIGTAAA